MNRESLPQAIVPRLDPTSLERRGVVGLCCINLSRNLPTIPPGLEPLDINWSMAQGDAVLVDCALILWTLNTETVFS